MVEGAALEMLFRGNSDEGSNPSLSVSCRNRYGRISHPVAVAIVAASNNDHSEPGLWVLATFGDLQRWRSPISLLSKIFSVEKAASYRLKLIPDSSLLTAISQSNR